MRREPAWRVFASEYNDTTLEVKGEGERAPSYVFTPLGAKVNRLFLVGVLTDVENIAADGELFRGHVSDPTGVFTLYSGQYNPEATEALSNIDVPAFVSVVGKSRTYYPEEGMLYVSVRPETIREVDEKTRDRWTLETCHHTKERIEAVREAMKMSQPNAYDLRKIGYVKDIAEGVSRAIKHYDNINLEKYVTMTVESLRYLTPEGGGETLPALEKKKKTPAAKKKSAEKPKEPEKKESTEEEQEEEDDESDETEKTVLSIVEDIEDDDGAPWDTIIEKGTAEGIEKNAVEEALNSLMDKGLIYEPVLGTIKTT